MRYLRWPLDGFNPALLMFAAVLLVFSITSSMDEPVFSRFTELFTANPAALGGLISIFGLSYLLVCGPAGALVDKAGTRRTLALGVSIETASCFVFWFTHGIPLYIIAAALNGAGSAIMWAAARVFVADSSTNSTRGKAFGLYSMSWGIGWAVGPLVGGAVGLLDIRLVYLAAGMLMALTVPAFLAATPKTEDKGPLGHSVVSASKSVFSNGIGLLKRSNTAVRWMFVAYAMSYFFWSVMWVFTPLHFEQFSTFEIGAIFFCNALAYAVGALWAGALADKHDKRLLLSAGLLLSAAGMIVFVLIDNFLMALAIGTALGLTTALTQPVLDTLLMTSVRKSERGLGAGVSLAAMEIGTMSAAALGGIIAAFGGYAAPFWFAAAVCLAGAIGTALFLKPK